MSVSEKDHEYFRRIGAAFLEVEISRTRDAAETSPGTKIETGVELSDLGIYMGVQARGSLMSATSVPEDQLLAQGSLPARWRERKTRQTA